MTIMKNLYLTGMSLALCLMTSLSSCSSDNKDEEILQPSTSFHFQEPLTTWGADQTDVESHMTGYTLVSSSPYSLIYEGKDCESSYLYAFSKASTSLSYVTVSFDMTFRSEALSFLEKNYIHEGGSNGNDIYTDTSHSTVIVTSSDSQFYLTYMSRSSQN